MKLNLISNGNTNAKTIKNEEETYILYLSPFNLNDYGKNICPFASKGCAWACLNEAGRGIFPNVQLARRRKTNLMLGNPEEFYTLLVEDLTKIDLKAYTESKHIFVRLNGTSDINFEKQIFRYTGKSFESFENLRFYDYTKDRKKAMNYINYSEYDRYRVTYSRSEKDTDADIQFLLSYGCNVAVVFSGELPTTYLGFPVIDGDKSDLRFFDKSGVVVGLKAKGKAKKDSSGFVVQSCKLETINQ